jgi:hypothetical protein
MPFGPEQKVSFRHTSMSPGVMKNHLDFSSSGLFEFFSKKKKIRVTSSTDVTQNNF